MLELMKAPYRGPDNALLPTPVGNGATVSLCFVNPWSEEAIELLMGYIAALPVMIGEVSKPVSSAVISPGGTAPALRRSSQKVSHSVSSGGPNPSWPSVVKANFLRSRRKTSSAARARVPAAAQISAEP